jgi:hypothetical protein
MLGGCLFMLVTASCCVQVGRRWWAASFMPVSGMLGASSCCILCVLYTVLDVYYACYILCLLYTLLAGTEPRLAELHVLH